MAGDRRSYKRCKTAESLVFAGGSGKFDVEAVSSAPVGLNKLPPVGLGLEEVGHAGARRARFRQDRFAVPPRESGSRGLKEDLNHPALDGAERIQAMPQRDLAEVAAMRESARG